MKINRLTYMLIIMCSLYGCKKETDGTPGTIAKPKQPQVIPTLIADFRDQYVGTYIGTCIAGGGYVSDDCNHINYNAEPMVEIENCSVLVEVTKAPLSQSLICDITYDTSGNKSQQGGSYFTAAINACDVFGIAFDSLGKVIQYTGKHKIDFQKTTFINNTIEVEKRVWYLHYPGIPGNYHYYRFNLHRPLAITSNK